MAQRARGPAAGLSERYGLRGRRGPVIAAAAAAACLAVVGALLLPGRGGGFEVTRAETGGAVTQKKAKGGRDARKGDERGQDEGSSVPAAKTGETKVAAVIVHVDGSVENPGVYRIYTSSPRVNDAVSAAGGLAEDADTTRINLAASLSDGQKVHVPRQGEEVSEDVSQDAGGAEGVAAGAAGDAAGAAGDSASSGTVDINTADATELQRLPGVGEATAAAIVEDRTRNGPFASPEDIMRVSGIGEKKFERMRAMIRV